VEKEKRKKKKTYMPRCEATIWLFDNIINSPEALPH
jgi:hypothetical protein